MGRELTLTAWVKHDEPDITDIVHDLDLRYSYGVRTWVIPRCLKQRWIIYTGWNYLKCVNPHDRPSSFRVENEGCVPIGGR